MDFDIWASSDGRITSLNASLPVVDDRDAPYGFDFHLIRLQAASRLDAIKQYRQMVKINPAQK